MVTRRDFLLRSGSVVISSGGSAWAAPDDDALPDGSAAKGMITPQTQAAIDQGLEFLARHQHADGSFGTNLHRGNIAITSLAAVAFLSGGSQCDRGPYGRNVRRALAYVLNNHEGNGFLHNRESTPLSNGPMYNHGFGTLFLTEVYGMVHQKEVRDRLRETLRLAVRLIIDSQNKEGGWRYRPEPRDADISVTICQIMALRAARNAGFFVPKTTVDKCIEYVKRCQEPSGGFRYMAQTTQGAGFARTAAGVVALFSAGIYKGREVEKGLQFLMQYKPPAARYEPQHYYYGHYYAVQAMWTAGGRYWAEWFPAIRDELTGPARRRRDGSWADISICHHYATAMACIILQVPNNYLPILQK